MSVSRLLLALLLAGGGCNEYWARDNPCDPRCEEGQVCVKREAGPTCANPDGGTDLDAFPMDLSPEAAPDGPPADMETDPCPHPLVQPKCANGWCTILKGCFLMGGPDSKDKREVTLTRDFEISETEITQGQYSSRLTDFSCHGSTPYAPPVCDGSEKDKCNDATCPVENVSWHQAAHYCNELNSDQADNCYNCSSPGFNVNCTTKVSNIYDCHGYRLPTEAEWEYAYRAGSTTLFHNGDLADPSLLEKCVPDVNVDMIAWYCGNAEGKTHPTAEKKANGWGLHDMAGNVWEWCHDWDGLPATPAVDPVGSPSSKRVYRGGSAKHHAITVTAHHRASRTPGERASDQGFRCVRSILP